MKEGWSSSESYDTFRRATTGHHASSSDMKAQSIDWFNYNYKNMDTFTTLFFL